MNTHEFSWRGFEIKTFIYDGDPERLKELWVEANGEYVGSIRYRHDVPSQEQVEATLEEIFCGLG